MSEIRIISTSSQEGKHFWTDMVCKDCKRCVRACPAGIDIPSLLIAEERIHAGEDEHAVKADWQDNWEKSNAGNGLPIDCIECGICDIRCPQGFPLLEIVRKNAMEQAVEYLEVDLATENEK
jgi:predicted aldo/keto reductase-like oxidoreductase